MNKLFDSNSAELFCKELSTKINVPYFKTIISSLGGEENTSIIVTISKDNKNEWLNGILENSRYARFHISNNGCIEKFSGLGKFRKTTIIDRQKVIDKINNFLISMEDK